MSEHDLRHIDLGTFIDGVSAIQTERDRLKLDLSAALAKVEELEKSLKLVQSHALTAWQRGNQHGNSSNASAVRDAVDAMNKARQVTLDENAIFTDLLERAEGRSDQLAALLREACSELLAIKAEIGFRGNTLAVIGRIDAALSDLQPPAHSGS